MWKIYENIENMEIYGKIGNRKYVNIYTNMEIYANIQKNGGHWYTAKWGYQKLT